MMRTFEAGQSRTWSLHEMLDVKKRPISDINQLVGPCIRAADVEEEDLKRTKVTRQSVNACWLRLIHALLYRS